MIEVNKYIDLIEYIILYSGLMISEKIEGSRLEGSKMGSK